MIHKLPAFLILEFCIQQVVFAQSYKITSPDKNVNAEISVMSQLWYSVKYNGSTVIHSSPLGFEFLNEDPMGDNMTVISSSEKSFDSTWSPVIRSKHDKIRDHYNELKICLLEKAAGQRKMNLYIRAYNDGIAFRYELFGAAKIGNRQITKELTGFVMNKENRAWVADYGKYTSSQESEFKPMTLSRVADSTIAGLPFLTEITPHVYAAITEAVIDNYPGFYIRTSKSDNKAANVGLYTKLSPLPGEKEDGAKARFANHLVTPWRVIMLAANPGRLIESELIQNLNPPCALSDVSWIKPGMSAWDNWWSGNVKVDMPTIKKYIDLASAEQWPYMLIDWQWYGPFNKPEADITKPATQLDMPGLLGYAKSKNVKCWVWLYSSDVNRNDNFEKAFPLYEKWGIAGIKIDFMDRDDQEMVNWYHRIIKTAARYHLMVDFHGAYKPDGIIRTYPNMITREGVMGEEYSKFSNRSTPEHNVTLPFTRMLAGQMDYTPGGFLNVKQAEFKQQTPTVVMNSRCAELAKFIIYESPFTVFCDAPEHILGQQGADFLKQMPTTWDDIRVLDGYPGEFIMIAKKKGKDWFVGAMTNGNARTLDLNLGFLNSGNYELSSWADVPGEPKKLTKANQKISGKSKISIRLDSAGGWVGKIKSL